MTSLSFVEIMYKNFLLFSLSFLLSPLSFLLSWLSFLLFVKFSSLTYNIHKKMHSLTRQSNDQYKLK